MTTNQQICETESETKETSKRMARWNQQLQSLSNQSNEPKLSSPDQHLVQKMSFLEEQVYIAPSLKLISFHITFFYLE